MTRESGSFDSSSTVLQGVYAYEFPESFMLQHPGIQMYAVGEDRPSYEAFENPERINLLIARQGAVNRMLEIFSKVRWLQLLTAGYEQVNLMLLRRRDILLTNASSAYCETIAEDVLCKILALARNSETHFHHKQQAFWPKEEQSSEYNIDLFGKTLGLLGAGNIGREVALRAKAFRMRVVGYDPYVNRQEGFDHIYSSVRGLATLLETSYFVVACLPLTDETRGLMDTEAFALMRHDAYFINVSRGEVVDQNALMQALNAEAIRGAALDVTTPEPLPAESPLWLTRNLLITPHTAAMSDLTKKRVYAMVERNIVHYLEGRQLENFVRY